MDEVSLKARNCFAVSSVLASYEALDSPRPTDRRCAWRVKSSIVASYMPALWQLLFRVSVAPCTGIRLQLFNSLTLQMEIFTGTPLSCRYFRLHPVETKSIRESVLDRKLCVSQVLRWCVTIRLDLRRRLAC